jgi:hypothetical protein
LAFWKQFTKTEQVQLQLQVHQEIHFANNLEILRWLDASISEILIEDSVLLKFPAYQYSGMKNIFKNLIRYLDNHSTPSNYGIPITVSNGEIH